MTEISDRYRRVAGEFTARVVAVPDDAWERPSPCDEWNARDVVNHVVDASGRFLGRVGVELPAEASQRDDPAAAWAAARDAVQGALDDPAIAGREYESPMGATTLERTIGMFGIGDTLVHTWDLARAAGLDERLDQEEVLRVAALMEANDEMMRGGTAFGPKVEVPDDADEQTRLLAFTGRHVENPRLER
jgi:uncharacterized protein (TIGR03086 family)